MGKIGNTWGRKMKEMATKGQKINLINCEKVRGSEAFHNYSSEIRCSNPVKSKIPRKETSNCQYSSNRDYCKNKTYQIGYSYLQYSNTTHTSLF